MQILFLTLHQASDYSADPTTLSQRQEAETTREIGAETISVVIIVISWFRTEIFRFSMLEG